MTGCALATAAGLVLAGLAPVSGEREKGRCASSACGRACDPVWATVATGPACPAKPCLWVAELLTWMLAGGLFGLAGANRGIVAAAGDRSGRLLAGCLSLAIEACRS